jgi:hypothetical protein
MFNKYKRLAALATLALTGTLSVAATAVPAGAATPACGEHCIEVYSTLFGTEANPRFVETVFHGTARVGQPTVLAPSSSANPASDLIPNVSTTAGLYAQGLVSSAVASHYGPLHALQLQYAPSGKPTGLCVGLKKTAYPNEGLSLLSCKVPTLTVFIIDTPDAPAAAAQHHFPIVVASTSDFAHPYAMTFLGNKAPNGEQFAPIRVDKLAGNPTSVPSRQLWGSITGPVK